MIYDYIFDFFFYLFTSTQDPDLSMFELTFGNSYTISFDYWLCHTLSIITIVLIFVFFIKFIIWLFKLFGGLFKW